MTFMMTFEEFQEKCVQNKEKIEKFSKILTAVLVIVLPLISYFYLWGRIVSGILLVIAIINTLMSKTTNDRIFSRFPAILGLIAVSIIIYRIAIDEELSLNTSSFFLVCIFPLIVWLAIYCLHCFSIYFLDVAVFDNPKLNYSSKIIRLEHEKVKTKHGINHYYYVYFYGFRNSFLKSEITEIQFIRWHEGDVIQTVLVPRIDGEIVCKGVWRPNNFEGLTDWELDKQQHEKDVELFGMSQEEMDKAAGESKKLSYKMLFYVIAGADLIFAILGPLKYSIINSDLNIICLLIAISITLFTSFKEYKHIKEKYTLEDMKLWLDYLLPRCLFYISATLIFLEYFYMLIN